MSKAPWEYEEIVVERGAAHYEGDRWLYAGPQIEIGHVSEGAPGGADAWAKLFKASPALVRALLELLGESRHLSHCPALRDTSRSCWSDCQQVQAALTLAGVPLP